jgi:ribosome-associated toxin RatA of RatAB toxin-antitoxin module
MCLLRFFPLFVLLLSSQTLRAGDRPSFNAAQWAALQAGQPVLMDQNPCLQSTAGKSYVSGAVLVNNSIENVWAVVNDAEAAPSYVEDMVTARVVAAQGNTILVEHGMKVNRREYKYLVRMFPSPGQKLIFRMERGSFRSLDGGWWLFPVQGGRTLLVHSLHFDPGGLCPKGAVRNSLLKKIPETLVAINGVVQRRSGYAAVR